MVATTAKDLFRTRGLMTISLFGDRNEGFPKERSQFSVRGCSSIFFIRKNL